MKKLLFILVAVTVISCSKSDSVPAEPCAITVFSYVTGVNPDGSTQYSLSYGPSTSNNQNHIVTQSTYMYYYNLSNHASIKVCWDGDK
ncbi:hypothetical protein [Flavobacterium sp. N1994]|uniref:hypothetical protein n=1 Tax=Flavobacterium sp. N1994 TaxID=2986827 RepID=UPI0022227A8A|nr:hypothetical protein [Flavobacterium sp. N1994]